METGHIVFACNSQYSKDINPHIKLILPGLLD